MLARKPLLPVFGLVACLIFTGCGPSFKAGRDKPAASTKSKEKKPETATAAGASAPSEDPAANNGEGSTAATAVIAGSGVKTVVVEEGPAADQYILGLTLERKDNVGTLRLVVREDAEDTGASVQVEAKLDLSVDGERKTVATSDVKLTNMLTTELELKAEQYTIQYQCTNKCANLEINVQRANGEIIVDGRKLANGYRATFVFEQGADKKMVLKNSSLALKQNVPTVEKVLFDEVTAKNEKDKAKGAAAGADAPPAVGKDTPVNGGQGGGNAPAAQGPAGQPASGQQKAEPLKTDVNRPEGARIVRNIGVKGSPGYEKRKELLIEETVTAEVLRRQKLGRVVSTEDVKAIRKSIVFTDGQAIQQPVPKTQHVTVKLTEKPAASATKKDDGKKCVQQANGSAKCDLKKEEPKKSGVLDRLAEGRIRTGGAVQ